MKSKRVQVIAALATLAGITDIGSALSRSIYGKSHIRVINYHSTPKQFMFQFERQLNYFGKHYHAVSKSDLEDLLSGNWKKSKPGLIISFDDGLESNYSYAKPLLEKYNFTGWFFVPSGLIGKGNCRTQDRTGAVSERYMSWEQIRHLHENHIIGCHTLTHKRLVSELDRTTMLNEICDSKTILEDKLQDKIDIFCWVGGESDSYSKEAAQIIRSNYKYSFLTNNFPIKNGDNPLMLERTNIEADWPIYLIKLYISVFKDLRSRKKRNEIRELLT